MSMSSSAHRSFPVRRRLMMTLKIFLLRPAPSTRFIVSPRSSYCSMNERNWPPSIPPTFIVPPFGLVLAPLSPRQRQRRCGDRPRIEELSTLAVKGHLHPHLVLGGPTQIAAAARLKHKSGVAHHAIAKEGRRHVDLLEKRLDLGDERVAWLDVHYLVGCPQPEAARRPLANERHDRLIGLA